MRTTGTFASGTERYVIDSYAWIEYFKEAQRGIMRRSILNLRSNPSLYCFPGEVERGAETPEGADLKVDFMLSRAFEVVELSASIALSAARINRIMRKQRRSWGLADSMIYATALRYRAIVVTGDEHFRDLPNVTMIK